MKFPGRFIRQKFNVFLITLASCLIWMTSIVKPIPLWADVEEDSLELILQKTSQVSSRINLLTNASINYRQTDLKRSLDYALRANGLAEQSGDDQVKIRMLLQVSVVYFLMSDLDNAMKNAVKANNLAESHNNDTLKARTLDAIGMIYYDIGDQTKSSRNFFSSLNIYEKLHDKEGLGGTFCRIGTLYLDQKDYEKALDYYKRSIELARQINSREGIASNLNNVGKVYTRTQQYEKAIQSFEEALKINLEAGNLYLAGANYLNIAEVYIAMKQYDQAINSVNKAYIIFEKQGNKLRLAKCEVTLGEIYLAKGQSAASEKASKAALDMALANGYRDVIVTSAAMLNKLFLANKDSVKAFRYFILEKQYRDSLFLDEKQKTLTRLELQYQFEKNERDMEIAKQHKNIAIFVISGCLFFSLIIIVLILKQLRLRAKKQQLEKENFERELEFKNKELVLNVMSLMKKNEMLADLSEKLVKIETETTSADGKDTIKKVAVELRKSQEEEIWKEFSVRFKEVHGAFYDKLLKRFPNLTPNELKLCAFLRLNMSSKDIAELTGQRITTLETARYRLRQKLGLVNSEINLVTFLSSL
jgi:tetratricopeptide (TPR) repeat protein